MRPTAATLAKAYTPMIKFVGGRHPAFKHSEGIRPHPCSMDGLLPGSKECVPVSDFLSKLRPFKVVPYNNPSKVKETKSSKNPTDAKGNSRYVFVDRPLQDNEVASISQLPIRFRFKPIDELESEAINNGGA